MSPDLIVALEALLIFGGIIAFALREIWLLDREKRQEKSSKGDRSAD